MKALIKKLLGSKKNVAFLVGGLVWLASLLGVGISEQQALQAIGLVSTFIVGVGLADFAKEKEKIAVEGLKEVHQVIEKKPETL